MGGKHGLSQSDAISVLKKCVRNIKYFTQGLNGEKIQTDSLMYNFTLKFLGFRPLLIIREMS